MLSVCILKPIWYCGGGCFLKCFSLGIHQNNIFFIFFFDNSPLKRSKNTKKIINLKLKKKKKFKNIQKRFSTSKKKQAPIGMI